MTTPLGFRRKDRKRLQPSLSQIAAKIRRSAEWHSRTEVMNIALMDGLDRLGQLVDDAEPPTLKE
jgi:hypothetical protein